MTAQCIFGSFAVTEAYLSSLDSLTCLSPRVELPISGFLATTLKITVNGLTSFNEVPFYIFGLCPEGQCIHGSCSFGQCRCFYSYYGPFCDKKYVSPLISVHNSSFELLEGLAFSHQLFIEEGTLPIVWKFIGPTKKGMYLNQTTGLFLWINPLADSSVQTVRVQAQNEFSADELILKFQVQPSYYVTVSGQITSLLLRPAPKILFNFNTFNRQTHAPVGNKTCVFWFHSEHSDYTLGRKVTLKTDSNGKWSRFYQPFSSDAGIYFYGAEHPSYNNVTVQGYLSIRGVDIMPENYIFRGYPGFNQSLEDLFLFRFHGGSFSNVSVAFQQSQGVSIFSRLNSTTANEFSPVISLSVVADIYFALSGYLHFTLFSSEGIVASSYIYFDIRDRAPNLFVSPSILDIQIPHNGAAFYQDVVLSNFGSSSANSIEIILPSQAVLRSLSSTIIPFLDVDNSTVVTLAFQALHYMDVGTTFSGIIGFETNYSSTSILYKVLIVSTVPSTLMVITQNEGSFLSEEKLNLPYVDVNVKSLTTGINFKLNSGSNGTVLFTELVEDFYEINAQKIGHKSFRTTIMLRPPGQSVEAFLQMEVVSYKFTVVPVYIKDTYTIEVKTIFKTNVPAPVIVWSPASVDWEAIRSGLVDEIQLTATNYGFIAVENVRVNFPTHWEDFQFILPEKQPGLLPANSSVTIPVKVKRLNKFSLPKGYTMIRDGSKVFYVPFHNDSKWESGIDFVIVPDDDPINGPVYYQLNEGYIVKLYYVYSNRTLVEYFYDDVGRFINHTITNNADFPQSESKQRELHAFLFSPDVVRTSTEGNNIHHRELIRVDNAWDCVKGILYLECKYVVVKLCERIPNEFFSSFCEDRVEEVCDYLLPPNGMFFSCN